MIIKASQRGGARQLAAHLSRTDENEHVELIELRHFVSDHMAGAFAETHCVSSATRCKQPFYSASFSPPPKEKVSLEVFRDAIERVEKRMGLEGQPRAIVMHCKDGRTHMHAVWSRIDTDSMTAINLPHFKLKMRDLSREIWLEQGWTPMPKGLANSAERDPRSFGLDEWQAAKRMGFHAGDLKESIRDAYALSDSGTAFQAALRARGLSLAKGDRRGHVIVSHSGEVLSLARMIGRPARDVRARLGEPTALPDVATAKAQFASDMTQSAKRILREANGRKAREIAPLEAERGSMVLRQREERRRIETAQRDRWSEESRARASRFKTSLLAGIWQRVTGQHAKIRKQNEAQAYMAVQRDQAQRQTLFDAQLTERQALQVKIRDVRKRHAGLFREIRQDRDRYRQAERAAMSEAKIQFERAGADSKRAESQISTEPAKVSAPFQRAAERLERLRTPATSAADRLEKLRSRAPGKGLRRDREPGIER